ncbi:hypothetical protein QVD17_04648 [Tagetes erecta]|uniref:Uncharacterized protein n=1 Tax=Tagetes erecta TaxID=13708 RepID=A0AAD8LI72_TARER|nr:hypothetical protein QVD17_04648 [Tagetes erecta]
MKLQQQQQQKLEDFGYAPSFSCYSSDSTTTTSVAKVIREERPFHEFVDDFEFSLSSDEDVSVKEIDSRGFPVFNRDLLVNSEVDDGSSVIASPLGKLFIDETDESSSYSSSEVDESESPRSIISKCKKSNSMLEPAMALSSSKQLIQKQGNSGEVLKAQKRKSYLPYRKDLVGLFANVNGMGKKMHASVLK